MNITQALQTATDRISTVSETGRLDAQVLLAFVLQKPRAWLLAHPEVYLNASQVTELVELLERLVQGEPLPYVLGRWEFYGRTFRVSPAVLIPRPETELLVETALGWLRTHPGRRRVIDVGCGSGCIAISLAAENASLQVTASDTSPAALDIARHNAAALGVSERVHCVQSDLLEDLDGPFDLLCANLPYIPTDTLYELNVYGKEPTLALDGGPDGLRLIEKLLQQATRQMAPGGLILLEIEARQGDSAQAIALQVFPHAQVQALTDLAGLARLVSIYLCET